MNIVEQLRKAMVESGRISDSSRITVESITGNAASDYRTVEVLVTRKRCRKPFMSWSICVDTARGLVHWNNSTFIYL